MREIDQYLNKDTAVPQKNKNKNCSNKATGLLLIHHQQAFLGGLFWSFSKTPGPSMVIAYFSLSSCTSVIIAEKFWKSKQFGPFSLRRGNLVHEAPVIVGFGKELMYATLILTSTEAVFAIRIRGDLHVTIEQLYCCAKFALHFETEGLKRLY